MLTVYESTLSRAIGGERLICHLPRPHNLGMPSYPAPKPRLSMPIAVVPSMPPDPVRHERQLEAVLDIAWAINSTKSVNSLLPLIMSLVTDVIEADRSTFFVLDAESEELWSMVLQGAELREIRLNVGEGLAGACAQSGEIVNLRDAYDDPRFDRSWDESTGYRTKSLVCVPIPDRDGAVMAVIQCLNKKGRSFDGEDEALLSAIGRQCAVAIENSFLYEELLERNAALERAETSLRVAHGELEVLYALERLIADASDEASLSDVVLGGICHHMEVEAAALMLKTENGGEIFYRIADGSKGGRVGLDDETAQQAMRDVAYPVRQAPDLPGTVLASMQDAGATVVMREALTVALSDGREQMGTIQVINRRRSGESVDAALRMLSQSGAQIARGISVHREREASERSERLGMLGHSTAAILHDLRTPMTAVGGYVELMSIEPDAEVRSGYVERINRAIDHMNTMTSEVMSFARGQRDVLIQKVYLDAFVEEVREMLLPETERANVELEIDHQYNGKARFDAGKLKRVILNLARNACQAMESGGRFLWRIREADDQVVFECIDDGPGIPEAIRGRLFESFATHGKKDGTGLGLAMAKKIVEAHGGSIECESSPGQGATFRIRLPN